MCGNGTCRTWVMAPGRNFGKRQCSVNNLNGGRGTRSLATVFEREIVANLLTRNSKLKFKVFLFLSVKSIIINFEIKFRYKIFVLLKINNSSPSSSFFLSNRLHPFTDVINKFSNFLCARATPSTCPLSRARYVIDTLSRGNIGRSLSGY